MAGNELCETLHVKSVYTFDEAISYMKQLDKEPTSFLTRPRWVNVKTNKEVYIGYNY